jgi:hypothetical protein
MFKGHSIIYLKHLTLRLFFGRRGGRRWQTIQLPKFEHLHFAERKTRVQRTPQKVFPLVLGTDTKIEIKPKMVKIKNLFQAD